MAAKYQVVIPPGAPVPGVGFVENGKMFTAPEGYVPSLTFFPANEEAKKILEATYAARKVELEKRRDRAEGRMKRGGSADDVESIVVQLEQLEIDRAKHLTVITTIVEPPKVEEGLSLHEINERLQAGGDPSQPPPEQPAKGGKAKGDDRKL